MSISNGSEKYQYHSKDSHHKDLNIYFNPGPGKMATTTLQESLRANVDTLDKDGYCTIDIAKGSKINLAKLFKVVPLEAIHEHTAWKEFVSFLDDCYERQHHIILSEEGGIKPQVWKELIQPVFSRWNVHILLGYRRYYEWAHSMYYQTFRNSKTIPPPINRFVSSDTGRLHLYTDNYLSYWRSLLEETESIIIYNMHQHENILKTVYCNVLTDTKKMCEKYSMQPTREKKNEGHSLEYTRIVLAANTSGYLHVQDDELYDMSVRVQTLFDNEWNMSLADFPRTCLTDEQQHKILNRTTLVEKAAVPNWFISNGGDAMIHDEFVSYSEMYLCSVDVDQVIERDEFSFLWERLHER